MSGLSWDSLRIVAVDGLAGDSGMALRSPIVRAEDGRIFVLRDVHAESVTPNLLISEDELQEHLEAGSWFVVPRLRAKRHHVVMVRAADFAQACKSADVGMLLFWEDLSDGFSMAYVSAEEAAKWQTQAARQMLEWGRSTLHDYLTLSHDHSTLPQVDAVFQQALYVCETETEERRELDRLIGVLLKELAPERWPAYARLAALQTPGIDAEGLEREVKQLRYDLLWSEGPSSGVFPTNPSRLWGAAWAK